MSPDLKHAVKSTGLTAKGFAAIVGLDEDTVSGWARKHHRTRGIQPEPIWAWHLIRAWTRFPSLLREAVSEAWSSSRDRVEHQITDSASGDQY